jgi:hypothetical protein
MVVLRGWWLWQGVDSGWYSLIMGLVILVVVFVCIGACIMGSYYLGKRQERKPEAEQSTVYQALKLWAMFIQAYVFIVALIAGGVYFFLPHLFVPALAFPVVGGILLGVVILFVVAYFLARKAKMGASMAASTTRVKAPRPDVCPVCNTKITSEEKYCPNCGAAIE